MGNVPQCTDSEFYDTLAAVTDSLENSGTLQQLRAQVRAGIYDALESPQVLLYVCSSQPIANVPCSDTHLPGLRVQEAALPLSRDNLVINELLREYLLFNGYRNTLSVLLPGLQSQALLCTQLVSCSEQVALLSCSLKTNFKIDQPQRAAEARQPQTAPFDRQLLADMLGVTEDSNTFKV